MGRARILEDLDEEPAHVESDTIDLSGFKPKAGPDKDAMPAEQVRAIAEASNFPSREPKPRREAAPAIHAALPAAAEAPPAAPKQQRRRHRTGRTMQFSVRTTPETVEAFYAIADSRGWLVAETMERALAALQTELAAKC